MAITPNDSETWDESRQMGAGEVRDGRDRAAWR